MRTIYLIRHGQPAVAGAERICLSATDLPLSPEGTQQGERLRTYFSEIPLAAVFSSDLLRARETAAFLSETVRPVSGLREIGVGEWEGLTFREIRSRWPEEYALRGEDPVRYGIPGGEAPKDCVARALAALEGILADTEGDVAVVAHAGLNRLLLCHLLGQELKHYLEIPQPYGCVNILHEREGTLSVETTALLPGK